MNFGVKYVYISSTVRRRSRSYPLNTIDLNHALFQCGGHLHGSSGGNILALGRFVNACALETSRLLGESVLLPAWLNYDLIFGTLCLKIAQYWKGEIHFIKATNLVAITVQLRLFGYLFSIISEPVWFIHIRMFMCHQLCPGLAIATGKRSSQTYPEFLFVLFSV